MCKSDCVFQLRRLTFPPTSILPASSSPVIAVVLHLIWDNVGWENEALYELRNVSLAGGFLYFAPCFLETHKTSQQTRELVVFQSFQTSISPGNFVPEKASKHAAMLFQGKMCWEIIYWEKRSPVAMRMRRPQARPDVSSERITC